MNLGQQYIFHEIEIRPEQKREKSSDDKPELSEVLELIEMYKHFQTDSKYTKIRHLLPTLRYTVLIDEMPSTTEDVSSTSSNSSSMIENRNRPRTV